MCFNFGKKKNQPQTTVKQQMSAPAMPQEAPKSFRFLLTSEEVSAANGHCEYVEPTAQQLEMSIEVLKRSEENFIILESSTPINNVTFFQATSYDRAANTVYVEMQIQETVKGETLLHIYNQTMPLAAMINVFNAFMQGVTPNLANRDYLMDV